MSLSTQAIGYLDITNAILRVGTLDVAGIQGVDAVTNVLKGNSVLLWDDQGSDMASPPFQLGAGAARSTSPPEIDLRNASGSNFMYAGLKLPNAWLCKFDLYLADTSTGNVHVQTYTESTTTYGDDGYQLIFDGANNTVTLEYDGAQIVQESVTLTTGDWETVVVSFNRGAWSVTYGDDVVLQIDDSERADVYDNPVTGQYFRMETDASTARKIRYFKITNNGPFLQANTNDISYVSGNVAIGHHATEYKLSVAGSANVGALDVQSNLEVGTANLFVDTLTGRIGVGTTEPEHALDVTGNVQVGTANLFVDTVNSRVGVGTTEPGYDLDVHGSANVGALTVSSVTSNLEVGTANLFVDTLTGRVGVGTSEPAKALEVTGTLRVTDGLSNVSDLSVVQDDLTVSSNVAVSGGGLELTQVSNVAQIKSSSNVVVQFEKTRRLVKYPRVKMSTDDESSTTGYVASASSYLNGGEAYRAFDGNYATYWHSQYPYYNGTTGVYVPGSTATGTGTPTGTLPTTELITQEKGEYITLKLEHRIQVKEVHIYPRLESTEGSFSTQLRMQAPQKFTVVGSNTGLAGSWEVLHSVARLRWVQTPNAAHQYSTWSVGYSMNNRMPIIIDVENDGQYRYVGLITKAVKYAGGADSVTISQLHFLGYPEHDPDSNGTDVVIKHKASKPFCADGNDPSLKLYYEPRNWTGGNILVDETSNGRDATLNNVIHQETPAAFEWTGADTSNIYLSNHGLGTGDVAFSIAFWLCRTRAATHTGAQYIFKLGTGGAYYQSVLWWVNADGDFTMDLWGQYNPARYNFSINRWYHICLQHAGGYANDPLTNRIFVNGEKISTAANAPGTLGQKFNLQGSTLQFGYGTSTNEYSHAKLGNFRIYNRVLTEHEIWQLFAMDREHYLGANLPGDIVLKNGRVGVGTSEPRAMLDVAGLATFDRIRIRNVPFCIVCPTPNDGAWISADPSANLMPFGDVMSTSADRPWDDTNLRFVCPVKGVYRAMASVLMRGTGNDTLYIYHNYTNTQDVYGHANFHGYDIWHNVHSETLIDCEAGDTIQFYIYASGSWYRGRHTYALVHQVS